jgi:hypothetical protein
MEKEWDKETGIARKTRTAGVQIVQTSNPFHLSNF